MCLHCDHEIDCNEFKNKNVEGGIWMGQLQLEEVEMHITTCKHKQWELLLGHELLFYDFLQNFNTDKIKLQCARCIKCDSTT
jgi:hypothetical protein